jgi:hypothetical protein
MITLAHAAEMIGQAVVYRPGHAGAPIEQGVITSVNDHYVFVRYGNDHGSKATLPQDLEPLHRPKGN